MTAEELSCQELVELVTEYLEESLPPPERARFEAHLAECPGCRAYLQQMQITIRLAGQLDGNGLSPQATQELLELFRDWKRG